MSKLFYIDDFLPTDQFQALKQRIDRRFVRGNGSAFEHGSDFPVRIESHHADGNWQEGVNLLGQECTPAIKKMITSLEERGARELCNWSVWFQYIANGMRIPIHRDAPLRKSTLEHTYSAILYCSDWEPGWGGEFYHGKPVWEVDLVTQKQSVKELTVTGIIEPRPNRMIVWSRDIWHAVYPVTYDNPGYKRTFLGTGWSSI
jgi:hypothetical protein